MMDRNEDGKHTLQRGRRMNTKKRSSISALFQPAESLCLCLAILFLFAGSTTTSIVQAQTPDSTSDVSPSGQSIATPPSVPGSALPANAIATSTPAVAVTAAPLQSQPTSPSPTIPPIPTASPSGRPTMAPSAVATVSSQPSASPTVSMEPSTSHSPTAQPSASPTGQPSWSEPSQKENKFRQNIQVGNGRVFTDEEIILIQTIYQLQTVEFSPLPEAEVLTKITTICTIDKQIIESEPEEGERRLSYFSVPNWNASFWRHHRSANTSSKVAPQLRRRRRRRRAQDSILNVTLNMDFTMSYESSYYNITQYPKLFQNWTNSHLNEILERMQTLNLNVTKVEKAQRIVVNTQAPSISTTLAPSDGPTEYPTISPQPTEAPTLSMTIIPTNSVPGGVDKNSLIAISVSVLVALAILLTGVFFWYRKRRMNREMEQQAKMERQTNAMRVAEMDSDARWTSSNEQFGTSESKAYGSSFGKQSEAPSGLSGAGRVASPNGSLHSNRSLLSEGILVGDRSDSGDEADTRHILADEFDQYQDENLEKMRADVEGNLEGCDGMMSQAVARALIDDVDYNTNSDTYWGGDFNISAPEIEASALGSVMDWLKRNHKASGREKREFFQDTLNKMTASVRYGVVGPEDGARTVHECAGLLGLKLAAEIPVTTIVISGMRKSTTKDDIHKTFSVFGDIALAAVDIKQKGYGILRFTSDVAVERTMNRFRIEEIVLDDVAVQLRVIRPGSNIEGTEVNGVI